MEKKSIEKEAIENGSTERENTDKESKKFRLDKKWGLPLIGGGIIAVLLIALIAVIAENNALRRAALSNSTDSQQSVEGTSQAAVSDTNASNNTANANVSNGGNSQSSVSSGTQNSGMPVGDGAYTVTYSAGNGWADGDTKMCSLELSLTNHSDTAVEGWNLVLNVDNLVSAQGWDGTWSVDGDVVTITNAEYNKSIAPGASVVLGCNIGTKTDLSIASAALNDAKCNVEKGSVDRNAQNNTQNNNGNGQNKTVDVPTLLTRPENAVQGDDWLFTDGNKIVDKDVAGCGGEQMGCGYREVAGGYLYV